MAAQYNTLDSGAGIREGNLSVWQVPCLGRWSHKLDTMLEDPDEGIQTADRCVVLHRSEAKEGNYNFELCFKMVKYTCLLYTSPSPRD